MLSPCLNLTPTSPHGQIWDLRVGKSMRSLYGAYLCGDAMDIKDGSVLTGSWRSKDALQLWDYGTGALLTNLPFSHAAEKECMLYTARFGRGGAAEGVLAAGGSGANVAKVLDSKTGICLGSFEAEAPVHAVGFVPMAPGEGSRGSRLAVCSADAVTILDVPSI